MVQPRHMLFWRADRGSTFIAIIIERLPDRFCSPEQPAIYEYKYERLNNIKARFPCHRGNESKTADA